MAKRKTEKAIDEVGRPTSEKAQAIHDAKGEAVTNYASDKNVAKRAATFVSDFVTRIANSRTELQNRWTVFYSLWNGDTVSDYFPMGRSVHVPEPYKAVEGFVPRAANVLIEQPGWFRVVGVDEAGKKNAPVIEKILRAQLKNDNFNTKFRSVLRDTGIYGDSPAKVRWKKRRRAIKYNEVTAKPVQGKETSGEELKLKRGKVAEVNLDGPTLELVDNADFFADLRYRDHQESPGVAFRQERFEYEVVQMSESGDYSNLKDLLSMQPTKPDLKHVPGPLGTMTNPATFQDIRRSSDGYSIDITNQKSDTRRYEFIEFWGWWDKDYDPSAGKAGKEKEYCITIARRIDATGREGTGWTCVRVAENEYWHGMRPAVVAHYVRRSHSFNSVGIIEPIVKLSAELDDSRNMALAARGLAAKPVVLASDDADIYGNNLVLDPGTVIRCRNTNAVKAMYMPDRSDTAWKAEDVIKGDIRETTGIISTYQGSSDAASETATSIVSRTREANKRISEACKNIAEDFLVPFLEMWHSMNQQMLTKERTLELVGEDGLVIDIRKVSPDEVAGRVNFEITALPEIEIAGLKAKMTMGFLAEAANFLAVDPNLLRPGQLLKKAYVDMFGSNDVEKVFPWANAPLTYRSTMDEQYVVGAGYNVEVQEGENYYEHLMAHTGFAATSTFAKWPVDAKARWLAHMRNTENRLKQELESAAPRAPIPQPMGQPTAQQAVPGAGAAPPSGPPGGPMQPPPGGSPTGPQSMGPMNATTQARSAAASNAPRSPIGKSDL